MLLTCDIGNTNIKCGIFEGSRLSEFNIFSSSNDFISYITGKKITTLAVSSVVPAVLDKIKGSITSPINIFEITKDSDFNLTINYDSPETLGIDRICSCEGAFYLYSASEEYKNYDSRTFLVTLDFGTATTMNIVKYPGEFTGGIITPGIRLMLNSLNTKTAQLPLTDTNDYKSLIGRTTRQSIASGVINSQVGLTEKTLEDLRLNHKAEKIKIYVTGGNAEVIIPHLAFKHTYEKALVLFGIKSVYEKRSYKE